MEDYMFIVMGDDSNTSPEQMQRTLIKYQEWMIRRKQSQHYISGSPFKPEGRLLQQNMPILEGGDFMHPEKRVGGFIWIKADSLDHATEIAEECPLLDNLSIIVRPFLKMS